MTEVTRRDAIAAAAATTLASMGASVPAGAAAPAAGRRAPGWYRYTVGDLEVTVVTDGARSFDLTPSYVTNAPIEEVRKALEAAYMPPNRMIHHYAPIVINTGGKLVVIDTGGGPGAYKETKGELGQFVENLAAAGIDPKSIDMVVISHFHGDHVNGLLDASNKLAFPNAEVLVPEVEWKFWMDDGEMSRASAGRMAGLFKNNRRIFDALGRKVTPYGWGKEIAPGVLPVATTGHSIGPHVVCRLIGKEHGLCAVGRDQQSGSVRAPSRLGRGVRPGPERGGRDAAQGLRHAGRRQAAGAGLPLSVPGPCPGREGGQRLSGHSGAVASDALRLHWRSR